MFLVGSEILSLNLINHFLLNNCRWKKKEFGDKLSQISQVPIFVSVEIHYLYVIYIYYLLVLIYLKLTNEKEQSCNERNHKSVYVKFCEPLSPSSSCCCSSVWKIELYECPKFV